MRYVLALALLLCSQGLAAQRELVLGIHTDEPAPSIGALLASARPDGHTIRVQSFASVEKLREELEAGRIDFALLEETGTAEAGASMVAEVYPSVLHVLYRGRQNAQNIGDVLRAAPIWAGAPGSIGHTVAQALARDFGVPADQLNLLDDAWTVEPEVYFIFGGILAPDALSRLQEFHLYSFDEPAALMRGSVVEGIALRYPNLRPFILPAQLYPALGDSAALTLSVSSLLVARETLDENVAYEMAAAIDQAMPQLAALYPMAGMPQLAAGAHQARSLPLHPGVQHYQDRDLPGFFERNSEILGMSGTVFLASFTAFVAWRRHRKQARKDKLDSYYQKLFSYRAALDVDPAERKSLAAKTRAMQADVLALVIDERIDANGALLAFLSLSNQILSEATEKQNQERV
jgi:TRAP-type uncharacterized transport system substrate-binding protein